jgi:hypothetical protein
MRSHLRIFLFIVLSILCLTACGKKGDPKPPEESAPSPVKNFAAIGEVEAVVLSWDAPETTVADDDLKDLEGFIVRRSGYVKGESPNFSEITDVTLNKDGTKHYIYRDKNLTPGEAVEYVVVPYNSDGVEGANSQVVRVTFSGASSRVEGL